MLDEAVATLKREDRDAITLRYFKGQSVGDVAVALGVSPDAAQKRVLRAVERLRSFFARRGVSTSSEALASALAVNVLAAAPAALTAEIAAVALSSAPVAGGSAAVTNSAALLMACAKSAGAIAAVLAVAAPVLVLQNRPQQAPGANPPTAVAFQAPAAQPQPPAHDWQARIDAVYGLADGEFVKRVPPPFIPERDNVIASLNIPGNRNRAGMDRMETMVFSFDGISARFRSGYRDTMDLADVLKSMLAVWPQDTDIDRALLATRVAGDWVMRDEVPPEKRLDAVVRHLADVVGAGTVLRSEPMEREVIVVNGTLRYTEELKPPNVFPMLHLSRDNVRPPHAFNLSAAQSPVETLQLVGELIGRPMVVEADLGKNKGAAVAMYELAAFRRAPLAPGGRMVDDILENLAKQTSLQFKRERRAVPTWRLVKQDL
jgi:hypothetical protein